LRETGKQLGIGAARLTGCKESLLQQLLSNIIIIVITIIVILNNNSNAVAMPPKMNIQWPLLHSNGGKWRRLLLFNISYTKYTE